MTTNSSEICLDSHRRVEIRARGFNGIDYVEIDDDHRGLIVHLLRRAPDDLQLQNIVIESQEHAKQLKVKELQFGFDDDSLEDDCLHIRVDHPGDRSGFTLKLVEATESGQPTDTPYHGFDPKYSKASFHFFTDAGLGLDCLNELSCDSATATALDINYLAKDYTSFRQLALDRLSLLMPAWTERHVADEGIALVEILAYVADYLSYYQDSVATEAYLTTARQRISVRRHVRLLDYAMHEGCSSRGWIQIQTPVDVARLFMDRSCILFLSGFDGTSNAGTLVSPKELRDAAAGSYQVFEPLWANSFALRQAHNKIYFYTWGCHDCYLPEGAIAATLEDPWFEGSEADKESLPYKERRRSLALEVGDYLLLEEALGPMTGVAADADPTHRWVVRLTQVTASIDPLNELPIVEIQWAKQDALPFPLRLATRGPAPHCREIKHVSVARGNVLLVEQGTSIKGELLSPVPLVAVTQTCHGEGRASQASLQAGRFQPTLSVPYVAWSNPLASGSPASMALTQNPRTAMPLIRLVSIAPLEDGSGPFVSFAELENPGLLARRLTSDPIDDASQLLRETLPRKTLHLLKKFDPDQPIDPKLEQALQQFMQGMMRTWNPRTDLLNSSATDRDFVAEVDDQGYARLRFGDSILGMAPQVGEAFSASYQVASGSVGNSGRETIQHLCYLETPPVEFDAAILQTLTIDNPLPMAGGIDPEPVEQVKMLAPGAYLSELDRAITADDYAQLAQRNPLVQRAAASLVWTGCRYEAQVVIDPWGTDGADPQLIAEVERYLYPFRRIGHDLKVVQAHYVPLDLTLSVLVDPGYLAAHVKRALLDALGNGILPNGTKGLFHPDNLTFGQSIYASQIIAAAQMEDGVESVTMDRLERLLEEEHPGLIDGVLPIGPLEIAQLDNDPVHPDRGRLRLILRGGR